MFSLPVFATGLLHRTAPPAAGLSTYDQLPPQASGISFLTVDRRREGATLAAYWASYAFAAALWCSYLFVHLYSDPELADPKPAWLPRCRTALWVALHAMVIVNLFMQYWATRLVFQGCLSIAMGYLICVMALWGQVYGGRWQQQTDAESLLVR